MKRKLLIPTILPPITFNREDFVRLVEKADIGDIIKIKYTELREDDREWLLELAGKNPSIAINISDRNTLPLDITIVTTAISI